MARPLADRNVRSSRAGIFTLGPQEMDSFLERRRASLQLVDEISLADNLATILRKANEFVPSAAGSILLDNPRAKRHDRRANFLTFVSAFGIKAEALIGHEIPANRGIAGHVYLSGLPYQTSNVSEDRFFSSQMDEITTYATRSLVAIPIRIEQEICGVLELINRQGAPHFSEQDRNLLQIFAGYISVSIQNILDGRRARELARRDHLTGLYNDHYLHQALTRAVGTCLSGTQDLAVLFLDLDYFKTVNDTHGHLAGSQVLREVGALFQTFMSQREGIAARYGGDEFVLVFPGVDLEEARDIAEEMRHRVVHTTFCAQPGDIQPEALNLSGITCSVGVATLRRHVPDGISIDDCKSQLIRLADAAMYSAKAAGRNCTEIAQEPAIDPSQPSTTP